MGLVVIVACASGAFWKATRPSLPLVEGRSIEEWVILACDQKAQAKVKVTGFGVVAVPSLARVLVAPEPLPSRVRRAVEPHVPSAWLRHLPETVDASMRRRVAVVLLAGLGRDAVGARVELNDTALDDLDDSTALD